MAKQANTMMIGGFVVIAFFLLAAGMVILGSGKLFKKTESFVLYFDSSIKGLNVGAPVMIQGVQIGSVKNIMIRAYRKDLTMNIPVFIEIDLDRFHVDDANQARRDPGQSIAALTEKGLRAVLSTQSFITGHLMIELNYYPDTQIHLKKLDTEYIEIPTIPSTTERLLQNLQKLDLSHIENIINGLDRLVNNPDLPELLKALRQTAEESRELVVKLDRSIDGVISNVDDTLDDTRRFINNANGQVEPLTSDLRLLIGHFDELARNLNKQVDTVTDNLNQSVIKARDVLSEDAPLVLQMKETLESITNMTDSIRQLADYLEQHPESLLRGKTAY
jgi:paraquat-inducible protein B